MEHSPSNGKSRLSARLHNYLDAAFFARIRVWKIVPLGGWQRVIPTIILAVLQGLLPLGFMLATSAMIGKVPEAVETGVGSAAWDSIVELFLVAAGCFLLQQILAPLLMMATLSILREIDGHVRDQAVASLTSSVGIAALEDSEIQDKFSEARVRFENNFHKPGDAAAGMLLLIARYVQLIGLLVFVYLIFGTWIGLAVTLGVAILRAGNRNGLRAYSSLWRSNGHLRRRVLYVRETTMGSVAAKEIRVFGAMPWLSAHHAQTHEDFLGPVDKERRRIYFKPYLVYTAIALVAVVWALVELSSRAAGTGTDPGEFALGHLSLQELTLGLQALLGAVSMARDYPESDTATQFGMNALTALREVETAVIESDTAPRNNGDLPVGAPFSSIEFRDLHFVYPGTDRAVFSGLNLTLEAGKTTALVGVNGAGKTTLMKLLARLYEPTSGGIYVDGVNITEFDLAQWRQRISVVFQDFVRYEFSAFDNIAVGAAHLEPDAEAVVRAAELATMHQTLSEAPRGFDTILARGYEDGIDLSGGQWQRVAIARSLYALEKGAQVLVLDEPTAALDVRAEAAFFDNFVELTTGATVLLISHRFSSVRRADRIVVIEHGHVIESGDHDSLMSVDSRYRKLFELQAKRFRDGLGDDDDSDSAAMEGEV